MTDGIQQKHRLAIIEELSANPGVERIVLFGSRVMGTFTPTSDVDIVLFGNGLTLSDLSELSERMAELSIPQRVDILLHHRIESPALLEHIRRHGVEWFARKDAVYNESVSNRTASDMGGERQVTTLDNVAIDVSYGYTESASPEMIGPKFLRITDIQGGIVNWDAVPYCPISQDDHDKYKIVHGDIVIARTGNSTGESYLFHGVTDAVFASYLIRFRLDTTRVDPEFVWYNLRTPRWWEFINSSKTGSAQAGANAKVLGRFTLNLPPLQEQRAIAHILGTLDDKIELNRRMSKTLEEMARAIFKSWFVDFDPVRANMERKNSTQGRQDARSQEDGGNSSSHASSRLCGFALNPEIGALFPDSFEDSELGKIPRGWRVDSIYKVADVIYGAPFASSQFNSEGVGEPIIRIRDLSDESPRIWTPEVHPRGYKVRPGNIIVGMDGEFRAYLWGGPEAWLNQRICVFKPKSG